MSFDILLLFKGKETAIFQVYMHMMQSPWNYFRVVCGSFGRVAYVLGTYFRAIENDLLDNKFLTSPIPWRQVGA